MVYFSNVMSLNMYYEKYVLPLISVPVLLKEVKKEILTSDGLFIKAKTYITDEIIAKLLSKELEIGVFVSKLNICLNHKDILYVANYTGPELKFGCEELPNGAHFKWFKIYYQQFCSNCSNPFY